jgi:translation initiation factor 1A
MRGFQKKTHDRTNSNTLNADGTPAVRVRLPKKWNKEQFARAELMMGANHIRVRCIDGVTRLGRIKGTMKKRTWIREGDTLIVTPWSFQDTKCDIDRMAAEKPVYLRSTNGEHAYRFQKTIPLCFTDLRLFTQEKYRTG